MSDKNLKKVLETNGIELAFVLYKHELNLYDYHTKLYLHLEKRILKHIEQINAIKTKLSKDIENLKSEKLN